MPTRRCYRPEALRAIDDFGPRPKQLRRAVGHCSSLVKRRASAALRLDALVDLLSLA